MPEVIGFRHFGHLRGAHAFVNPHVGRNRFPISMRATIQSMNTPGTDDVSLAKWRPARDKIETRSTGKAAPTMTEIIWRSTGIKSCT